MEHKVFTRKTKFKLLRILILTVSEFSSELARISRYRRLSKPTSLFAFPERTTLWSGDVLLPTLPAANPSLWTTELVVAGTSGGESITTPQGAIPELWSLINRRDPSAVPALISPICKYQTTQPDFVLYAPNIRVATTEFSCYDIAITACDLDIEVWRLPFWKIPAGSYEHVRKCIERKPIIPKARAAE